MWVNDMNEQERGPKDMETGERMAGLASAKADAIDVVTHNFPTTHSDFLTQYIDYGVPIDKFNEIARFDGSCLVDRTAGEAAGRCDSEWANTLTLNLMHDIVTGKTTVEEARKAYAENAAAFTMGRSAHITDGWAAVEQVRNVSMLIAGRRVQVSSVQSGARDNASRPHGVVGDRWFSCYMREEHGKLA
jgi:hypothetical protein